MIDLRPRWARIGARVGTGLLVSLFILLLVAAVTYGIAREVRIWQ